ncbi:hypothetical protein AAFF_G00059640 [Aldrovandia affinis]|uniref:PiggyBac transposable element-derived protein domain-containing protein n=1 Tax=Aldrovandia affinis TaxID=143900 RepID=A0AAD7WDU6_9TELE|nr:hypothetical protein AAFF_G00059640 [Aldrovandia affinis]
MSRALQRPQVCNSEPSQSFNKALCYRTGTTGEINMASRRFKKYQSVEEILHESNSEDEETSNLNRTFDSIAESSLIDGEDPLDESVDEDEGREAPAAKRSRLTPPIEDSEDRDWEPPAILINTNKNAERQKKSGKTYDWRPLDLSEMFAFLAMVLFTGLMPLKKMTDYWSKKRLRLSPPGLLLSRSPMQEGTTVRFIQEQCCEAICVFANVRGRL